MDSRLRHALVLLAAASALGLLACRHPAKPTPVCAFTIEPASRTFLSGSGTGAVTVIATAPSCEWTATASASWITVLEGATGTGSGQVKYSVAANLSTDGRAGTLSIDDQIHSISQQGQAPTVCTYAIAPASASVASEGGTGSVAVSAPATCPWTAVSNAPWLVVTSGGQGVGNGTVAYSIGHNEGTGTRTAAIAVADQTFAVTQSGQTPLACEYSVSPVQFTPCMPNGTQSTTMTTQASCPWSVTSNAPWLVITSGDSGTGPGSIGFSFSANYDAPREGIVMVRWPSPTAGQNVRVSQAGCHYGVSKTSISFGSAGGPGIFDVLQQSEPYTCGGPLQDRCVWTAVSDVPWITITTGMPRAGDNPVSFQVAPNGGTARAGTITVRDKVVQITQAGL